MSYFTGPLGEFYDDLERIGPGGQFSDSPLVDSGLRVTLYGEPPKPSVLAILDNPVDEKRLRKMLAARWMGKGWGARTRAMRVKTAT